MSRIFLFILFPLFIFSQHIDYKNLSDQQLHGVLQKELLDMEARGATPDLILEKFVIDRDVYLMSRESYYRFFVHTEYLVDKLLANKMQNGTDEPNDFEMVKKFKELKIEDSFQEYLDSRKTEDAKEQWENSTHDGILKLVVDSHEQFNEEEQKRYNGLIILLNTDPYFSSFQITDGQTIIVILPDRAQMP